MSLVPCRLSVLFLLLSTVLMAQTPAVRNITGSVRDVSGAAIVGASVTLEKSGTEVSHAATGSSGIFNLEVDSPALMSSS